MRVGVTGASGLIGVALVAALEGRGDTVVRFVRPDSAATSTSVVRWDPQRGLIDDDDLVRVGGFDAVVHLAGAGIGDRRWTAHRKEEILRSRVASTTLLAEAISSTRLATGQLLTGSAIGYYGSRDDELLDESSAVGDDFLAHVCQAWEAAAVPLERTGTSIARLRTGIVLSARGGALARQLPIFRAGLGGTLSTGRQWLSSISLRDEVAAIIWIIDYRLSGPFNLAAPTPVTNREFTKELGLCLHRPTILTVPALALKVALGAELATGAVLASQRVVPAALSASGFTFTDPDIRSILRATLAKGV